MYAVVDIVHFFRIIFIKSTLNTAIFTKFILTFTTLLRWLLYFLTVETLYLGHFFELHPFDLASLLELKFLIVA